MISIDEAYKLYKDRVFNYGSLCDIIHYHCPHFIRLNRICNLDISIKELEKIPNELGMCFKIKFPKDFSDVNFLMWAIKNFRGQFGLYFRYKNKVDCVAITVYCQLKEDYAAALLKWSD